MPSSLPHVTLIGCGKMGSAMLRSWLNKNAISKADIIDINDLPNELSSHDKVNEIVEKDISSDIIIIAVKPQIIADVAQNITGNIKDGALILSIAAGKKISTLSDLFGEDKAIIRTMPNTPAAIGKGISISVANNNTSQKQINIINKLLLATGKSEWVDDENLIDAVTAISGSGPAYIFYFIEALAKAGEKAGLPLEISKKLARQTVIGSAALAEYEDNISAQKLRENVTSPNGTTAAALNVLMDGRFQEILNETVAAATTRSKELN